jgi:hypothetical protein
MIMQFAVGCYMHMSGLSSNGRSCLSTTVCGMPWAPDVGVAFLLCLINHLDQPSADAYAS